jgi:hypothetical protein
MTKHVTRWSVGGQDNRFQHEGGEWVRYDDIKHLLQDEPPAEPVAYLKEWTMDGEPRRRVDLRRQSELWLEEIATVTPLYPAVNRSVTLENNDGT